jgi:hypothetical protein
MRRRDPLDNPIVVLDRSIAITEAMALNQADRDWLELKIKDSIAQHSKRKVEQFKSWSPLGVAVAIGIFFVTHLMNYTEFRVRTDERLGRIEKDVQKLSLQSKLENLSESPISEFRKQLSSVSELLAVAKKQQVGAGGVEGIRRKILESGHDAPDYWQAAAALVNYRSPADNQVFPQCLFDGNTIEIRPDHIATLENCQLQLDSEVAIMIYVFKGRYGWTLQLKNCLIVYKGGVLTPAAQRTIKDFIFVNCKFVVDVPPDSNEIPPAGKALVDSLLAAQDPTNMQINFPQG